MIRRPIYRNTILLALAVVAALPLCATGQDAASGTATSSTTETESNEKETIHFRRILAPLDHMSDWPMDPEPHIPMDPDEFERLLKQTQQRSPGQINREAGIRSVAYKATLDATGALIGEGLLTVRHESAAARRIRVPIQPCNLAIDRMMWQAIAGQNAGTTGDSSSTDTPTADDSPSSDDASANDDTTGDDSLTDSATDSDAASLAFVPKPAYFGSSESGQYQLFIEEAGNLRFDWSLRPRREENELKIYHIVLPQSPCNHLLITLPGNLMPSTDRGLITLFPTTEEKQAEYPAFFTESTSDDPNEPTESSHVPSAGDTSSDTDDSTDAAEKTWLIELGGHHDVRLRLESAVTETENPESTDEQSQTAIVKQSSICDISFAGAMRTTDLDIEAYQDPLTQVVLHLEKSLTVVSADISGMPIPWNEDKSADASATPADRKRIVLTLPEPLQNTRRTIRLRTAAPISTNTSWQLPRIQPQNLFWREGRVDLRISLPLTVSQIETVGCRQLSRSPLPSPREGESIELQQFSADGTVSLTLSPRRMSLQAAEGTTLSLSEGEMRATISVDYQSENEELFSLDANVTPSWIIDSINTEPADALNDWELVTDGRDRRLMIYLSKALAPHRPIRVYVSARRLHSPLGQWIPLGDLIPLQFEVPGDAIRRYVSIHATGERQLQVRGDYDLQLLDEGTIDETAISLLDAPSDSLMFENTAGAAKLEVLAQAGAPGFIGEIDVEAALGDKNLTETYRLHCRPAARIESVLVAISQHRESPIRWTIDGDDSQQPTARMLSKEERAITGYTSDFELWEITLRRPQGKPFVLLGQRRHPLSQELTTIGLAILPDAESQKATVRIRRAGTDDVRIEANNLQPLSIRPTPTPKYQAVQATYRYDPTKETSARLAIAPKHVSKKRRAWIWHADLVSRYEKSGEARHIMTYCLECTAPTSLQVTLPENTVRGVPRGVWVNGRHANWRIVARPAAPKAVEIDLPQDQRFPTVTVHFDTPSGQLSTVGTLHPPLPKCDFTTMATHWTVWLPPGYSAFDPSDAMLETNNQTPELTITQRLLGPLGMPLSSVFNTNLTGGFNDRQTSLVSPLAQPSTETPNGELLAPSGDMLSSEQNNQDLLSIARATALDTPWVGIETAGQDSSDMLGWAVYRLRAGADAQTVMHYYQPVATRWIGWLVFFSVAVLGWARLMDHPRLIGAILGISGCAAIYAPLPYLPFAGGLFSGTIVVLLLQLLRGIGRHVKATEQLAIATAETSTAVDGAIPADAFSTTGTTTCPQGGIDEFDSPNVIDDGDSAEIAPCTDDGSAIIQHGSTTTVPAEKKIEGIPEENQNGSQNGSQNGDNKRNGPGRSTNGWLLPFAAAILGLLSSSITLADGPESKNNSPEHIHRVIVPCDEEQKPTGDRIHVPRSLYDALHRLQTDEVEVSDNWLFISANYKGSLSATSGSSTFAPDTLIALFKIQVLSPGARVRIPFDHHRANLLSGKVLLDGDTVQPEWNQVDRSLLITIDEPGMHDVELSFLPSIQDTETCYGIDMPIPRIAVARLEMSLPAATSQVQVPGALGRVRRENMPARIEANLGPTDRLNVCWAQDNKLDDARIDIDQLLWMRVSPGSVAIDVKLKCSPRQGSFRRLRLQVDPALRLLPKSSDSTAGDEETEPLNSPQITETTDQDGRNFVTYTWPEAVTETTEIETTFLFTGVSGVGRLRLPVIRPVDSLPADRRLAITIDPSLEIDSPDTRLSIDDFLSDWGEASLQPTAAWHLKSDNATWNLSVRSRSPESTATQSLSAAVGRRQMDVRFAAQIETVGYVFQHTIDAPPQLRIDNVTFTEDRVRHKFRISQSEAGPVTIFFDSPVTGVQKLQIEGRIARPLFAADHPADRPVDVSLPTISLTNAMITESTISLWRLADVDIQLINNSQPMADDANIDFIPLADRGFAMVGRLVSHETYDGHPENIELRVRPNRPVFHADAVMRLKNHRAISTLPGGFRTPTETWSAEIDLFISHKAGRIDRIFIDVDRLLSEPYYVDSPDIELVANPYENGYRLTLRPVKAITGDIRLRIVGNVVAEPGRPIAAPQFTVGQAETLDRYIILPRSDNSGRLTWMLHGLREDSLPQQLAQQLGMPVDPGPSDPFGPSESGSNGIANHIVYSASRGEFAATANPVVLSTESTKVTLADISLVIDESFHCRGLAAFDLLPGKESDHVLMLPEKWNIIHTFVNQVPLSAESLGAGLWRIPTTARLPKRIEVVITGPLDVADDTQTIELPTPRFRDFRNERTLWTIVPPASWDAASGTAFRQTDEIQSELLRLQSRSLLLSTGISMSDIPLEDMAAWFMKFDAYVHRAVNAARQYRNLLGPNAARELDQTLQRIEDRRQAGRTRFIDVEGAEAINSETAEPIKQIDVDRAWLAVIRDSSAPLRGVSLNDSVGAKLKRRKILENHGGTKKAIIAFLLLTLLPLVAELIRRNRETLKTLVTARPLAAAVALGLLWWLTLAPAWIGIVIIASVIITVWFPRLRRIRFRKKREPVIRIQTRG